MESRKSVLLRTSCTLLSTMRCRSGRREGGSWFSAARIQPLAHKRQTTRRQSRTSGVHDPPGMVILSTSTANFAQRLLIQRAYGHLPAMNESASERICLECAPHSAQPVVFCSSNTNIQYLRPRLTVTCSAFHKSEEASAD